MQILILIICAEEKVRTNFSKCHFEMQHPVNYLTGQIHIKMALSMNIKYNVVRKEIATCM